MKRQKKGWVYFRGDESYPHKQAVKVQYHDEESGQWRLLGNPIAIKNNYYARYRWCSADLKPHEEVATKFFENYDIPLDVKVDMVHDLKDLLWRSHNNSVREADVRIEKVCYNGQ